jgi:two-component system response regulator HydG
MTLLKQLFTHRDDTSTPIISVVAGSGQITRAAVGAGADLIIALNAGLYRTMGLGSLAAFMPFGNANDQTEELLRNHILPHRRQTPVVAGVFASDPTRPIISRLERLKDLGVEGVTNWPAVGFLDGVFRQQVEADGLGIAAEIAMLKQARQLGFLTIGFALSADDARQFAQSGADSMILNVGLTTDIEDTIEKRNQLQLSITKAREMLTLIRKTGCNPVSLIYGGAITEPEDFEEFIRQVPVQGYAGGSVFERLPVVETVHQKVERFRRIPLVATGSSVSPGMGTLVGSSAPMQEVFKMVQKIAPYDVHVCIEGESGTGKELIASQLHTLSPRRNHPFITVNCGAVPDTLVESEFFGYEKGAFTGAMYRRLGKFELANRGTLFLDEIADLSPHAQATLLRVIQQGEVVTLGGQKPIPVNVRILCASNQHLEKLIAEGKFREDLYFRLSTITINLPPLRERPGDISLLVSAILARLSVRFNKKLTGVTDAFLNKLQQHSWPGNVRELEQVLTRCALLEDKPLLEGREFRTTQSLLVTPQLSLSDYERAQQALITTNFSKTKAAKLLGISRNTLYLWLKQHNS